MTLFTSAFDYSHMNGERSSVVIHKSHKYLTLLFHLLLSKKARGYLSGIFLLLLLILLVLLLTFILNEEKKVKLIESQFQKMD